MSWRKLRGLKMFLLFILTNVGLACSLLFFVTPPISLEVAVGIAIGDSVLGLVAIACTASRVLDKLRP